VSQWTSGLSLFGVLFLIAGCPMSPPADSEAPQTTPSQDVLPQSPVSGTVVSCITADDVLTIPPGNATGTELSGQYRIVSGLLTSCRDCERNTNPESCSSLEPIVTEGFIGEITQEDGVIMITDANGGELVGGINNDGSFSAGTIIAVTDNEGEIVGQANVLFSGRFVADRILADTLFHFTANTSNGISDLVATGEVVYEKVE